MATQFVPPVAAGAVCANAAGVTSIAHANAITVYRAFLIVSSL
jgi:hypothetical protein